jgi:hypothetical protein
VYDDFYKVPVTRGMRSIGMGDPNMQWIARLCSAWPCPAPVRRFLDTVRSRFSLNFRLMFSPPRDVEDRLRSGGASGSVVTILSALEAARTWPRAPRSAPSPSAHAALSHEEVTVLLRYGVGQRSPSRSMDRWL